MELPLPLSVALQKGIDAFLKANPELLEQMSPLHGKVLRIQVSAPSLIIVVGFVDTGVELMRGFDGEVDATIRGSLTALMAIRTDNAPLYRGDVSIDGDMTVALAFKKFVSQTDFDVEALIAPVVGGSAAHQLVRIGDEFASWFERTASSFESNVSEYLSEETDMVASQSEIDAYVRGVDDARSQLDRLAARMTLLEKGVNGD